ncbi:hypothetical protein [Methylophaga sp.]|uniref:hypothetical protein n=1 Tax=Methylophaga sp. TaxID=2024840 RepID=UPI003A94DB30
MSDGIYLTDYHNKVESYLSSNVPWLCSVKSYAELKGRIKTPCAFFAVNGWEKADSQQQNGQLSVDLDCVVLVVFGESGNDTQTAIRNAAMALSYKIDDCRFGMPVDPAVFISAEPDGFNPDLNGYEAWAIRYSHQIDVGEDEFSGDGITPSTVRVGYTTPSGSDREPDEYEEVISDAN